MDWRWISKLLAAMAIISFLSGQAIEWMLVPTMGQNDTSAYYLVIIKYGVATLIILVAAVFCALMNIGDLRQDIKKEFENLINETSLNVGFLDKRWYYLDKKQNRKRSNF